MNDFRVGKFGTSRRAAEDFRTIWLTFRVESKKDGYFGGSFPRGAEQDRPKEFLVQPSSPSVAT